MTEAQQNQARLVLEVLKQQPRTMLMVSKLTGIERANIYRYVSSLINLTALR